MRTATDFVKRRKALNLRQVDVARATGRTDRMVQYWESGKVEVPTYAWHLIECFEMIANDLDEKDAE